MNRAFRFMDHLPPGDRAIAGFLLLLTLLATLAGLSALIRSFQVTVPAYGGSFTEGIVGSPRFVNPLLAVSDSDHDLVALTYAGLMGHAADGALVPVIAESYAISADGTIYTFKLRSNAQFSDGSAVTADDVVYTVQKAQDPALKSPLYGSWSNIRAEAVDARTVRFTLPKAYAPFLEDATLGILPKHVWQYVSDEEFPFSNYNTIPVGAGPYTVSSVSRDGSGTITEYKLAAFKNFALGRPYIARITFAFYGDSAELQTAYSNGDIDSTYGIATDDAVVVPYARVFGVFFNDAKNTAFTNKGVRKALSLAVNRTQLVENVFGGYATPLMGPLPAGSSVRALLLPSEATRLIEARDALSDAGYEFNEETHSWSKNSEKLTVRLTTTNIPELKAVAEAVKKDWEALGVPVEIELYDPSTLTQSVIRPRNYSALLFGEVVGSSPDLYAFWSSSERQNPGLNIANYSNDDVDALLEKARTQNDRVAQTETLAQVQETIANDYPAAFLYTPDFLYNAPSHIQGMKLSSVTSPSDRFWGISSWYRYTEHIWPFFVHEKAPGITQ